MPKAERLPFIESAKLDDDHLQMIEWLHEFENSTPETVFRSYCPEDYRFYAGDQDTQEVKEILEEQNRPISVFNEVKPKIDMLVGLAAQSKFQPDVLPVGQEDEPLAEIVKGLLHHKSKKSKFVKKNLDCFEHSTKVGRSLLYFYIDAENPFKPIVKMKRLPSVNFIVDPQSFEYDMTDARALFIDKWMSEKDIKAFWPKVDVNMIKQHHGEGYPSFWNEQDDLYRIIEAWYWKYIPTRWFINPLTGEEDNLPVSDYNKFVEALSKGIPMPDGTTQMIPPPDYMETMVRKMHYMIFSDIFKIEGGPSPFRWKSFPGVLFGAYRNDDSNAWFGAVRMMKDPQISLNTMRRQLLHLLQTLPKGILKLEAGAVLNLEEYEKRSSDPSFYLEIMAGKFDRVGFEKQPPISAIYRQFDLTMSQSMKDSSGIQDDLMGIQQTSREPGITVQARQQTGIAVLYILYNNFRESRLESARLYLSLLQQFTTNAEVIRIEGEKGKQLMEINTQMNPQSPNFNDVGAGEYDLEVDESIENSTLRLSIAQMLTDFSQNNPGSIPPSIIMEYANLPFTVKQEVQATWEAQIRAEQENLDADRALKIIELSINSGIEKEKIAASVEAAKNKGKEKSDGK
jgi:hypothetical protein